jgi:hypothetical protein
MSDGQTAAPCLLANNLTNWQTHGKMYLSRRHLAFSLFFFLRSIIFTILPLIAAPSQFSQCIACGLVAVTARRCMQMAKEYPVVVNIQFQSPNG